MRTQRLYNIYSLKLMSKLIKYTYSSEQLYFTSFILDSKIYTMNYKPIIQYYYIFIMYILYNKNALAELSL